MTIRVTSDAGVAPPLVLLSLLLLGGAGPASAQGRSSAAVEMCLEHAEDVLRDSDRGRGADVEVEEITRVDERGGDRVRVRGRLRVVVDGDDSRRGTARLDCEVDLGGENRVTRLDEDGLLRALDRRRERERDGGRGRGGDAIGGDAIGGDGGDAVAGEGGVAVGGRGGDARGGDAVAGRDGGCRAERGRDGSAGGSGGRGGVAVGGRGGDAVGGQGGRGGRGGDAVGGQGGRGGDGGDAVAGRGGDAACF